MDVENISNKLHYHIEEGELREIQLLLDPVLDKRVISEIEEKFLQRHPATDPINLAISHKHEPIAIYLVEKEFSTDRIFHWDNQDCDQWCYYDHGIDICASQYTAADHAEKQNLYKLNQLINEIRQGKRKPGQSLTILNIPNYVTKPAVKNQEVKSEKHILNMEAPRRKDVEDAHDILDKYGKNFSTKDGNTLLHLHLDKPRVYIYIFASAGVPVNIQNTDGDTALHIAVRSGLLNSVEALSQCCADLNIRNKMGMTALDEADPKRGDITAMLNTFKPGIVTAICKGNTRIVEIYKRYWGSTEAVPNKEGRTLLEFAEAKAMTEKGTVTNCFRILQEYRKTSELTHAILCEDVDTVRSIIQTETGWTVNIRFKDRIGKTLLSQAIESNNLELVTLLVDAPARAKIKGIRVREHEGTNVTVPLFHKALHPDINIDIAKYLHSVMKEPSEHSEKDKNGNTAVLRAIENDCSVKFIQWLIQCTKGLCLVDRNKDALTPRELAQAYNRDDVVKMIDKYIIDKMIPVGIPKFSGCFLKEKDIVSIKDEQTGKTLAEKALDDDRFDAQKWLNFHDVQNHAIRLFEAASLGNVDIVEKTYDSNYKDKNGYTAMIRAVAFQQYEVVRLLCITRPILKSIPDNCNRYPLHYAYALPEAYGKKLIELLLEQNPQAIEQKVDKDGRSPADYAKIRDTLEIQKMLYDARTLDLYGKRGPPLGPWPDGASRRPPDENQPMDFLDVM
ncbi:putative ankyrin repeat protein RF_0381 isoform X3 [Saccostrea echinata]|uniref:putative ankyrin repeat protein RF_0381 isoform X3 n=1 Tax=Saccostrea echinata TaxID=191078 RepID=UPI002A7F4A7F|nr:putative ankyrin repeat protein RF_0381 isoform X3 [Saccostrea echinata]